MFLYLDLEKAVGQIPSTGTEPQSGRQARQSYMETFDSQYGGVLAGHSSPDDPNHGSSWSSGPTVEDELDNLREEDDKYAQEQNLVPEDKKKDQPPQPQGEMSKSLEILSTLTSQLQEVYQSLTPNDQERSFLLAKGFDPRQISLGNVRITGPLRNEFNVWLHENLSKSLNSLLGKL